MIAPGTIVVDERGGKHRITHELGQGGQGVVYDSIALASGTRNVTKLYHPNLSTRENEKRLDALVQLNLSARSPALCGPTARLQKSFGLGVVMPRAEGVSLEEQFATMTYDLFVALGLAAAFCRALAVAEALGVAHGDIAAANVTSQHVGDFHRVHLIDWDNALVPGAPAPSFVGQDFYMAPELIANRARTSIESDRYALGVLLHELLFLRHPYAAALASGISFDDYAALLQRAWWMDDPMLNQPAPTTGLPVEVLPREVHALFRRALQVDPSARPSAQEWVQVLEEALGQVFACSGCGARFVNERSRYNCPLCGKSAEVLALHVGGRVISLGAITTAVGRDDVGGDPSVSRVHAAFSRHGYGLRVRTLSENGLAVKRDGRWREFRKGEETDVAAGERIVFAPGVEGVVKERRS